TDYPDTLNNFDESFPGFPVAAGQGSKRTGWSNAIRSTLTQNLVNEGRVAYSGSPVTFFAELNPGMYTGSVANTKGFHLTLPNVGQTLTSQGPTPTPQSRHARDLTIEDTLNRLTGSHNIHKALSYTRFTIWAKNSNMVPRVAFGMLSTDPAAGLFVPGNFIGASNTQISNAQNLYTMLTGRITQITADARIDEATGQYTYMGTGTQR